MPASGPEALAAAPTGIVISDAGPLIALGRLDVLHVLPSLFTEVQVPAEVIAQCMGRPGNADAARIRAALDAGLLQRCEAEPIDVPGLDAGECAAIARALEIGGAAGWSARSGR